MNKRLIKATADAATRKKAVISILAFGLLAILSIVMCVYDITVGLRLYGILFGIAAVMFIVLLILKINSVFATYIKAQNNVLYMKSWANDFLPYEIGGSFFADLKPSRTKITQVPFDEIETILIGAKDFIKRNMSESGKAFAKAIYPHERTGNKSRKKTIATMDMIYVETNNNECCFMCIEDYDPKSVVDIIGAIYDYNPTLYVKVNSREYKRYITKLMSK